MWGISGGGVVSSKTEVGWGRRNERGKSQNKPLSMVATLNSQKNIPRKMLAFRKNTNFVEKTCYILRTTNTHFKA